MNDLREYLERLEDEVSHRNNIFKKRYEDVMRVEAEIDDLREYLEKLERVVSQKHIIQERIKFCHDIIEEEEPLIREILTDIDQLYPIRNQKNR